MNNKIIIYNTEDGKSKINLKLEDGTVWLNQLQIAELFQTTKQNISKHIKAILEDGELEEKVVVNYQLTTTKHGAIEGKVQSREVAFYNLDMILAIGYRVRSPRGVQFRKYASTVLKEYLIKGFAMDDDRLKNFGGGSYFKELLERIRDIRSSEKVFYRQVLELFSTSIDYDKNSEEARKFFSTVQNKMHYAIHHHTASELIFNRVDGDKEFMGLTTFKGELPTLKEAKTAKNYLSEKELRGLNQLVSGYLDFAERQAEREVAMTMADWIKHVDNILRATGEDVLENAGSISRKQMEEKVEEEYKKYSEHTLTPVEKDYLEEIRKIEKISTDEIDDFDLLLKLAYGQKPLTKAERVNNVKKRGYLYKYSEEARAVLEVLLERYMNMGLKQVEEISILKLPEFNKFGGAVNIIKIFGDKQKYKDAVKELENEIFSAA